MAALVLTRARLTVRLAAPEIGIGVSDIAALQLLAALAAAWTTRVL
jgi:hypothetical protein